MGFDFCNARRQLTAENVSECVTSVGVGEHGLLAFVYDNSHHSSGAALYRLHSRYESAI